MELCAQDAAAVFLKDAVPVGKVERGSLCLHDVAVLRQIPHRLQHILHLAAVGSGVHIDRTAHRAGDAVGKFQPGQAVFQCGSAQARKLQARTGDHSIIDLTRRCPRMRDLFQKADAHFQGHGSNDHAPVTGILK